MKKEKINNIYLFYLFICNRGKHFTLSRHSSLSLSLTFSVSFEVLMASTKVGLLQFLCYVPYFLIHTKVLFFSVYCYLGFVYPCFQDDNQGFLGSKRFRNDGKDIIFILSYAASSFFLSLDVFFSYLRLRYCSGFGYMKRN